MENKVAFEILISTMERTSLSFLEPMFPYQQTDKLHILVVNQTETGKELYSNLENIRVINSYDTGLSKSRNLAIQNAKGDICLIADDDIEYLPNFEKTIQKHFEHFDMASVILFRIDTFNGETYKIYPDKSKQLTHKRELRNASSVEIAFRREKVVANGITFDINFGLGGQFPSGEEYLFLKNAFNKGLQIYFINNAIVKHHLIRSTSNMADENFIKTQAAIYYGDYKTWSYFTLLKYIVYLVRNGQIPFYNAFSKYRIGLEGIKSFRRLKHEQ